MSLDKNRDIFAGLQYFCVVLAQLDVVMPLDTSPRLAHLSSVVCAIVVSHPRHLISAWLSFFLNVNIVVVVCCCYCCERIFNIRQPCSVKNAKKGT